MATRRAFISFQWQEDGVTAMGWGTANLPWPTPHHEIQALVDRLARQKGASRPASTIVTSMAWISDPED